MSSIIDFLAAAGVGGADSCEARGLLGSLDAGQRSAVETCDPVAIARAAGIPQVLACYVTAPENEPVPDQAPDESPDETPDGTPDQPAGEPDPQDARAA